MPDTADKCVAGFEPESMTYDIFDPKGEWVGWISSDEITQIGDERTSAAIIHASSKEPREPGLNLVAFRDKFPGIEIVAITTLC